MFGIYPGCTKHLVYNQSQTPLVSLTFGLPLTPLSWTREKTKYFEMDERKDFEMSGIFCLGWEKKAPWFLTQMIESQMEQQWLHGRISPWSSRRLGARSRWKDSTTRWSWCRCHHQILHHRWHKEHCQPLQLAVQSLLKEAGRSPSTSGPPPGHQAHNCHQCRWQPVCGNVSYEAKEVERQLVSSVRSSSGYHGLIEIRSAAATHFFRFLKFFRF